MAYSYGARKGGDVLNKIDLNLGFKNGTVVTILKFLV